MNVSITEDATISRTRSEAGANVVRVDAIVILPERWPAFSGYGAENFARPAVSLLLNRSRVNEKL
jgi:hypothetical protein